MARSSEYRGEPLKELEGKTHFVCEACLRRRSIKLELQIHHVDPQSGGGENIHRRLNLALLDGCHPVIHKIAASMAGTSKNKRPARELAEEYAHTVATPENVQAVVENLLRFAAIVAAAISKKKNKLIEGGDVTVSVDLIPRYNSLFKIHAKTIKDANGRPLGKERLTHMAILGLLASKTPDLAQEIQEYIQVHILRAAPKEKAKPFGITAQRM